MDINSLLGVFANPDTIKQMGKATKADPATVQNVLNAALPSLLGGAQEQSQDKDRVDGFAEALTAHGKNDTDDLRNFMGNVDLEDGDKIVAHLFGGNKGDKVESIARAAGVPTKQANSILSAAAPLLMALLGKQLLQNMLGGGNQHSNGNNTNGLGAGLTGALVGSLLGNMDMGSLLGGMMGGGNTTQQFTNNQHSNNGGLLGGLLNFLK